MNSQALETGLLCAASSYSQSVVKMQAFTACIIPALFESCMDHEYHVFVGSSVPWVDTCHELCVDGCVVVISRLMREVGVCPDMGLEA
jgi:hypothetical protein